MSKRKAYRPKIVLVNPLARMVPMDKPRRDKAMLFFWTALADIVAGKHPGAAEWRDMADACNLIETLVFQEKLPREEVLPHVAIASESMRESALRFKASGEMRISELGIVSLQRILHIHEQVLEELTEREIQLAVAETKRAIIAIQRNKSASVISL